MKKRLLERIKKRAILWICDDREVFCRSLIWKPPPHFGMSVELSILELYFLVCLPQAVLFLQQTREENCALRDKSLSPL